jgi:tetratricopeptide (TPR) repeat protein
MSNKISRFIFAVLPACLAASLIFSAGCSILTTPTSNTTTRTTTTTKTIPPVTTTGVLNGAVQVGSEVLYQDDFSDPKSGWLTGNKESGDYYYESGEYSLLELKNQYLIYANKDKIFSDFAIQVDVRFVNLGQNGSGGLVFRQRGDSGNAEYYLFAVNNDSFELQVRAGGQWRAVQQWKKSNAIRPSPNTNRLMAACLGNRIDLYANSQLLGSYEDNTLSSGMFGVEAGEANTHVHFDNLIVYSVSAGTVSPGPPEIARQYYDQAVQYRKSGDYTQAFIYYQKAITEYHWYYEAWYEEAALYYETGEYDQALNCYFTVTEMDPENSSAWVDEGKCLEALNRNDEAMSCYNRALELDPENAMARANKDALLARGVPDNSEDPPEKQYDKTNPLKLTGPVMVIHLKEGEPFSTTFSVEGGQPPYFWRLITTNGVAVNIGFTPDTGDGISVTVTGYAAMIDSPSSTSREARVEIAVEDSSSLTREGLGSFWLHVDNSDDSEIAAQVAREWYAANYGGVNEMMQNALAGVGYGGISESYGTPISMNDGSYQVTITIKATAGAEGVSTSALMDVILTIDTGKRQVIDVYWGNVSVSY